MVEILFMFYGLCEETQVVISFHRNDVFYVVEKRQRSRLSVRLIYCDRCNVFKGRMQPSKK